MNYDSDIDFSVITVCRNAARTISRCAQSIVDQEGVTVQYIVIDGASTDATLETLVPYSAHIDTLISESDAGIYDAMNKGLAQAKGRWVAIINADDALMPDALSKVKEVFERTGAGIVHGNIVKERTIAGKTYQRVQKPVFSDMKKSMGVNHPATFVSRSVYDNVGFFDTRYALSADYDFILKAYEAGVSFSYFDEELTLFSLNGQSNLQCKSFYETFLVHQRHKTGFALQRFLMIIQCTTKKTLKSLIRRTAMMMGMSTYLNQRLAKKWSN